MLFLFCSSGEMEDKLRNMVEIWGHYEKDFLARDEFFFILDALFKGLSKGVQVKNQKKTKKYLRLLPLEVMNLVNMVFKEQEEIQVNDFVSNFAKSAEPLYNFLNILHNALQDSQTWARQEQL